MIDVTNSHYSFLCVGDVWMCVTNALYDGVW